MENEVLVAEPEKRMDCPRCKSLMHWCSSKRRVANNGVVYKGCMGKAPAIGHPKDDSFLCLWCGEIVSDSPVA